MMTFCKFALVSILAMLVTVFVPAVGRAQFSLQAFPGRESFSHELLLIIIGAVLGGFIAPILMAVDMAIGISPGAKQQRENYEVQREIAASLRQLVEAQTGSAPPSLMAPSIPARPPIQ